MSAKNSAMLRQFGEGVNYWVFLGLYTSEKKKKAEGEKEDARSTSEVDRRAVLDRVLVAPARLGQLLLEELVPSKLGATLEEVADRSRAESGGETADALPVPYKLRARSASLNSRSERIDWQSVEETYSAMIWRPVPTIPSFFRDGSSCSFGRRGNGTV